MLRRFVPILAIAFAVTSIGCVPVTEPVGDIEKAEPDKALVGEWTVTKSRGLAAMFEVKSLTVELPEVKGNPKGLMRGVMVTDGTNSRLWIFTHIIGKHTYASIILAGDDRDDPPQFDKEGAYEKWKKEAKKRYFIFQYARDGNKLTLDCGNLDTFTKLMTDAKINGNGSKVLEYYFTPTEWLDKYLDKTGPDKLFDGSNKLECTRAKK
jgi:hypothetical protein